LLLFFGEVLARVKSSLFSFMKNMRLRLVSMLVASRLADLPELLPFLEWCGMDSIRGTSGSVNESLAFPHGRTLPKLKQQDNQPSGSGWTQAMVEGGDDDDWHERYSSRSR
jgi:hypothetical protein